MSSKNLLLILVVLAALALGGGLFLLGDGAASDRGLSPINPADLADSALGANSSFGGGLEQPADLTLPAADNRRGEDETTVAWPLEVRLELLEAKNDPQQDGVPRKGTGGNARLVGSIRGEDQKGVAATVTFVAGANEGLVLHADQTGSFGVNSLFPGLALVRVVSGRHVAMREISLRQARDAQLNVSFARTTDLTGEVVDKDGKPIEGAEVQIDGQEARTDLEGVFRFSRMASGKVYVQVDKPGYASHRENLMVAGGHVIERGTIKFTLEVGATLRINVAERVGSRGDALLYFLPSTARGLDRRFPWHELNPTRVVPGGSVLLEDLPAERVNLWLFHTGAVAAPSAVGVRLRPGTETVKTLHLEPAEQIKGVVKQDGEPVRRARVTCEAPDRLSASMSIFGEGPGFFDADLLPSFPVAIQEVFTDDEGKFALTAWSKVAPAHYVTATSQDGQFTDCKILTSDKREVELNLEPVDVGDSEVEVALADRFQGLPVKVWINGAPQEPFVLPADKELIIRGLNDGAWSFHAKWNSEELHSNPRFILDRDYRIPINLPEGALIGQTKDELLRAGKL